VTHPRIDLDGPLPPTMTLLLQFAMEVAPEDSHEPLFMHARALRTEHHSIGQFRAEAAFMRVLQDGLTFGKWPYHTNKDT
jgi:hypothetical protein